MTQLTKRERVDAALRGETVDRVPVSAWRHFIPEERQADSLARLRESVAALQNDAQRRSAARDAMEAVRAKAIAHLGAFDTSDGGRVVRWRHQARPIDGDP